MINPLDPESRDREFKSHQCDHKMNNRRIDISSEGKKDFELAIKLALGGKNATHFLESPEYGMILYWSDYDAKTATKLMMPMNGDQIVDLVWNWLQQQPKSTYKDYLDHDGDNGEGFRIFNEDWGHVAGSHCAICAIQPIWAWYGK